MLALAACAGAYLAGVRRVRRWPATSTAAFLAGLALLGVALESGLHAVGERLLSVHMVQHLVLLVAVPPLLIAGRPQALALRALPPASRRALARLLGGRTARVATDPIVVLALLSVVLVATHLPAFYDAAVRSPLLHDAEHVLYLTAALLFWIPVLALPPQPRARSPLVRVLLVLASMPAMTAVGVALATASTVVYAPYADGAARYGTDALADQRLAGTIMWIGGSALMALLAVAIGWRAVLAEEQRQLVRERAGGASAGVVVRERGAGAEARQVVRERAGGAGAGADVREGGAGVEARQLVRERAGGAGAGADGSRSREQPPAGSTPRTGGSA
nr:cytochrome c oxidase assembly protein [Conexibacter arvalis]